MKALLLILFCLPKLMAQQATVTASGNSAGTGGTISYSIGQVADKTQTGTTGTITQGVQQPFEIVTLSGSEFENIRLEVVVFPNPTISTVTLKISDFTLENLNYQLYDIQGKLLFDGKISSGETVLDMENYTSGAYVLRINSKTKSLKTFKIIKN
jgi:hypothetical protein